MESVELDSARPTENRKPIKGLALRILAAVFACAASIAALLTIYDLGGRAVIITLFILGLALAGFAGWVLGKGIWFCTRKGGLLLCLPVLDAAATGYLIFALLATISGHPVFRKAWFEAPLLALSVLLVVATSYVAGAAILPGGDTVPNRRRIPILVLLYGSALAGVLASQRGISTWGKLPPTPVYKVKRVSFEKCLQQVLTDFPPAIRRNDPNKNVHYFYPSFPPRPPYLPPVGKVIRCEDSEVTLEGGTLKFVGYGMISSGSVRKNLEGKIQRPGTMLAFWGQDGSPLEKKRWPAVPYGCSTRPESVFVLDITGNPEIIREKARLVFAPWGLEVGYAVTVLKAPRWHDPEVDRLVVRFCIQKAIPGPLELHLDVQHGEDREYILEATPGRTLDLDRNAIHLLGVFDGKYLSADAKLQGWDGFGISRDTRREYEAASALFLSAFEEMSSRLEFEALDQEGNVLSRSHDAWIRGPFIHAKFGTPADRIDRIRILERSGITRVVFPIRNIPLLPQENYAIDDLLDLQIPGTYKDLGVREIAGLLFNSVRYRHVGPIPPPDTRFGGPPPPLENPTLRELLEAYYKGGWWVEKQFLYLGRRPRQSLIWKVRQAIWPTAWWEYYSF